MFRFAGKVVIVTGAAGGRVAGKQSRRPEGVDGGDVAGSVHLDYRLFVVVEEVGACPARRLLPRPQAVPVVAIRRSGRAR